MSLRDRLDRKEEHHMKVANMLGERFKNAPKDCVIESHALMMRGGYMKYMANGIFSLYTPAKRIMRKIEQIIREQLPIPLQDYMPRTLEERLICYADKFYSKTKLGQDKPMSKVRHHLWRYGSDSVRRFDELQQFFEPTT